MIKRISVGFSIVGLIYAVIYGFFTMDLNLISLCISLLTWILAFNFITLYLDDFNYSDNKYIRISQKFNLYYFYKF